MFFHKNKEMIIPRGPVTNEEDAAIIAERPVNMRPNVATISTPRISSHSDRASSADHACRDMSDKASNDRPRSSFRLIVVYHPKHAIDGKTIKYLDVNFLYFTVANIAAISTIMYVLLFWCYIHNLSLR